MDDKTKKDLLEMLHYFLGILKTLKSESKKRKLDTYKTHCDDFDKVKSLIEKIK